MTFRYIAKRENWKHTDDEINLWAETEPKKPVAHKSLHLNVFDNAVLSNSL